MKPILFFLGVTILVFWQFFFKGLYPFPGNFMLAWYEPWRSDYFINGTITIPHKAVAEDTFKYIYPLKILAMDMMRNAQFPLWNPYNGAGMPLLASYQVGFFTPFNILFLFISHQLAWSIYVVIQAFLLTYFTYVYCRKIKISPLGSIFSAITFLFSGFVIARLIFGNFIYPLLTLPLILYLIEDYIENPQSKKIFFLPVVLAFMLLSGHPHMMAYTLILSVSYFLYRILTITTLGAKKISSTLFIAFLFLLGIGIAGIQVLPTIELFKNSNMNISSSAFIFNRFLLPPSHLISILIPNYFGNQATYNYWGAGDYIETVAAIGLTPAFFAYLSFFEKNRRRKTHRAFFLIVGIISIFSTLDWLIPKALYNIPIPIISTSPPSRIFGIATFAIAILAGYGLDRWILRTTSLKRLLMQASPFIISIIAIIVGTFLFYRLGVSCNNELISNCRLIAVRNTSLEVLVFVAALVFGNKMKQYAPFGVIILTVFIGMYNSYKFLPFSQEESMLPIHPLIKTIKEIAAYERVFGLEEANISTNLATHFRFYDPNYYDPLHNKRYSELVAFSNSASFSHLSRSDIQITTNIDLPKEKQTRRNRLLSLLGVGYLIGKKSETSSKQNDNIMWENEKWYVLKNNDSLPRAYFVNSFEMLTSSNDILSRLFDPSFDPSQTVLLEEPLSNRYQDSTINNTNVEIENQPSIAKYTENSIIIKAEAKQNSILVLSDNYYPGWKAYTDERETNIYRANYTFRAIELPKGKHEVIFTYQPKTFYIGSMISAASALFLGLIFILKPKKIIPNS